MNRRDFFRKAAIIAAGAVAADQLELLERLTHVRRLFPSAPLAGPRTMEICNNFFDPRDGGLLVTSPQSLIIIDGVNCTPPPGRYTFAEANAWLRAKGKSDRLRLRTFGEQGAVVTIDPSPPEWTYPSLQADDYRIRA